MLLFGFNLTYLRLKKAAVEKADVSKAEQEPTGDVVNSPEDETKTESQTKRKKGNTEGCPNKKAKVKAEVKADPETKPEKGPNKRAVAKLETKVEPPSGSKKVRKAKAAPVD